MLLESGAAAAGDAARERGEPEVAVLLMDVAKRSEYIWSHHVDNFLHAGAHCCGDSGRGLQAAGVFKRNF